MRNDRDDKAPGFRETVNTGFNIFVLFAQIWTRPLQLLTTRPGTAGKRYFGSLSCGLGLMFFPFAMAFAIPSLGLPPGQEGFEGVLLFWLLMIVAGMVQRAWGVVRRKRGYHCHSSHWGLALLPGIFSPTDSPAHKLRSDMLLAMLWGCGFGVLTNSPPVIFYGVFGAFLMIVPAAWYETQDNARIEAAEDAEAESEWLAGELRKRRAQRRN